MSFNPMALSAGTQSASIGTLVFSNSNNITFGMSGSSRVTASYAQAALSSYTYYPAGATNFGVMLQSSISLQPFVVAMPITFTRLDIPMQLSLSSSATTNTANIVISSVAVLYTRNASTLSPIVGVSGTTTHSWASNTANFNSVSGGRFASFNLATQLQPGEYYLGFQLQTANTSSIGASTTQLANTLNMVFFETVTQTAYADFGALSAASSGLEWCGLCSSSISATSQTLQLSQFSNTGTQYRAARTPILFRN